LVYIEGENYEKQTAGRDALGTFAPKFAELNDDVLLQRKCGLIRNYIPGNCISYSDARGQDIG